MLGGLCGRPRTWLLSPVSSSYTLPIASDRVISKTIPRPVRVDQKIIIRTAASIWHAILPYGWRQWRKLFSRHHDGEGSWNVGWDARPVRWLYHPDSAWFLFGLAAGPVDFDMDVSSEVAVQAEEPMNVDSVASDAVDCPVVTPPSYRVTGVAADGRCLFRAIAHMACLRNGEEAPDEIRQGELADELRAQVVEELLKRRNEVERFIEEDFDAYIEKIKQPYVWGGEPELLMASYVLRTPISVFKKEKTSGSLTKVASYGEEYEKEGESHINVLFHGYGHYDILETVGDSALKQSITRIMDSLKEEFEFLIGVPTKRYEPAISEKVNSNN